MSDNPQESKEATSPSAEPQEETPVSYEELDEMLAETEHELSQQQLLNRQLTESLQQAHDRIAILQAEVAKFSHTGWNEARAVKLRRLETFYSMFTNAMLQSQKSPPLTVLVRLNDLANRELKHLPENPWNDMVLPETPSKA